MVQTAILSYTIVNYTKFHTLQDVVKLQYKIVTPAI